jgi:multicomponent Na+:H+ antiporter subunit C
VSVLPYAVTLWVMAVGIYGVVTSRDLIHMVICLSVMQSSSYLLLLSIGYVKDASAPVFADVTLLSRIHN